MIKRAIWAITSPISQTSWHAMRALWWWLNAGRTKIGGLKRSIKEVQASVQSYFKNATDTSNAVAEWSEDIAKLVWWLPYKVRMIPAHSSHSTILAKNWNALYMSEKIFQSNDFQQQLATSAKEQWLTLDPNKLRVSPQ